MPGSGVSPRRLCGAVLLGLQLATVTVGATVDSGRASSGAPHVERAGATSCPAPHDEAKCPICQAGANRLALPTTALPQLVPQTWLAVPRRPGDRPRPAAVPWVGAPRAPPAPPA